jgi:hypothetical protein
LPKESDKLLDLTKQISVRQEASAFHGLGSPAKEGVEMRFVEMRFFAVLVAICALSQAAIAQTSECKSISDSGARLACYDKSAPPVASATRPALHAALGPKVDTGKYVDSISAEDALMNAQLRNICRGC